MELTGQIALVTGASRGIGAAIAESLCKAGARVIGTATTPAGAEKITAALHPLAGGGRGAVLNVLQKESIDALLAELEAANQTPAILVNNAAITRDNLLMRMKDEEWHDIINANLTAVYHLSKGVIRAMMKARSGRIINVTSVVGQTGNAGQTNYAAAKAGMIGFTKSLAKEVANRGITVNAVAPGFIDTDMTKELNENRRAAILTQIPMSRLGTPQDIAAAVLYLASPAAAYVTGETISVNGGMHMP